jgi:predicted transcriptional regulator
MIRLLGDMRAYNYVIIPTHDFDQVVYKIRAIDFDQQSYEGNFSVYRPQLYKENGPVIELIKERLINSSINQYKIEERAIIVKRILGSKERIESLIDSMKNDIVSTNENIQNLARQIYHLTQDNRFKFSKSMGDIMESSIDYMINNYENHSMLGTN